MAESFVFLRQLRGDFTGGFSAALISIPSALAYGIMAFAPLGDNFQVLGALSGITCCIFNGTLSAALGGSSVMISGPKASVTLVISTMIASLAADLNVTPGNTEHAHLVLLLTFFLIFLAGVFQALFGLLKIGNIVKYTPYPTISGFINGTALLIIINQLWILTGYPFKAGVAELVANFDKFQIFTVFVGILTILVIVVPNPLKKKMPAPLAGLAIGSTAYYLLYFFWPDVSLGPTLGELNMKVPYPEYAFRFSQIFSNEELISLIIKYIPAALVLATLMSIDTLVNSLAIENITLKKSECNRELVGQGVGNFLSACFGGISGAGKTTLGFANFKYGGRTKASGVITGISILALTLFLQVVLEYIPKTVMAGILIGIAYLLFDRHSLKILSKLVTGKLSQRRESFVNLSVILIVTATAVGVNMIAAVIVGLCLALLMVVFKTSKSIISREFLGGQMFSKKQRPPKFIEILFKQGKKVAIFELEGYIFFSTADDVASRVASVADEKKVIILDMHYVKEIDITGAKVLTTIFKTLHKKGVRLFITYLEEGSNTYQFLKDLGVIDEIGKSHFFKDTDEALEYAEEYLINDYLLSRLREVDADSDEATIASTAEDVYGMYDEQNNEIPLQKVDILSGLSKNKIEILEQYMFRLDFNSQETIFKQGDEGNSMFIILQGEATVSINLEGKKTKRLIAFGPGTVFGEMALIDRRPRSANVVATENLICQVLSIGKFEKLKKEHPDISITLLQNISKEMSYRVRMLHSTLLEMERK